MANIRDLTDRVIEEEWTQALLHAEIGCEAASYWLAARTPESLRDVAAHYFGPGLDPAPPYAFSDAQWNEAVSAQHRNRHRVVLHGDYELPNDVPSSCWPAFIGGLIRHELEHAKQNARWGPDLFNIYDQFIHPAMGRFFGGSIPGIYVNASPVELDANAAASAYIRERHPACVEAIKASANGNLVRAAQPQQSVETLLVRSIAFLYVFRDPMAEVTGDLAVGSRLSVYSKEAASVWDALEQASAGSESSTV